MTVVRGIMKTGLFLGVWLGIAKMFGSITFTPGMTYALVRSAGIFGIHGDENVEDFYVGTTMIVALVLALVVVWILSRRVFNDRRRVSS